MAQTPEDEGPVGAVPETGAEKDQEAVDRRPPGAFPVAAQGIIKIFPEPGGEGNMPAAPEIADGAGRIGEEKVFADGKAEHFPHADSHVGIAGEIEADLQTVAEPAQPGQTAVTETGGKSRVGNDCQVIRQKKLLAQVIPAAVSEPSDDSNILMKLCRLEQANIDETFKNLNTNREGILEFCKCAAKADVIYCMGWGISALPAEWLYTRFSELGLKSVLMRRGSLSLIEQARVVNPKDMLIVCELPSYVIEVTEAVEKISDCNAPIASITDSPAAPVCSFSGMHFYVSDHSPLFGSSLIGSMFAVHVLTSMLARNMGHAGEEALAAQKEGLTDKRIYYPSYSLR